MRGPACTGVECAYEVEALRSDRRRLSVKSSGARHRSFCAIVGFRLDLSTPHRRFDVERTASATRSYVKGLQAECRVLLGPIDRNVSAIDAIEAGVAARADRNVQIENVRC